MKKMGFLLAASMLLLGWHQIPAKAESTSPTKLSKAQRESVMNAIKRRLKDPDSAKFGDIIASLDDGDLFICGFVNAKNSYGGYTGMQPFLGLLFINTGVFHPTHVGGSNTEQIATLQVCANHGLHL